MARPIGSKNKKEEVKKEVKKDEVKKVVQNIVKEVIKNEFDPNLPEAKQRWLR
jgi:hypothetical protein